VREYVVSRVCVRVRVRMIVSYYVNAIAPFDSSNLLLPLLVSSLTDYLDALISVSADFAMAIVSFWLCFMLRLPSHESHASLSWMDLSVTARTSQDGFDA